MSELSLAQREAIAAAVPELSAAPPEALEIEALSGFSNLSVKVSWGGYAFAARITCPAPFIDRRCEGDALLLAQALGLGPEVVHHSPALLITRFAEGARLTRAHLEDPALLDALGADLRSLHSGPAFGHRPPPAGDSGRYLSAARAAGVSLPPWVVALEPRLRALEQQLWHTLERPSPCHRDTNLGNWLVRPNRRLLIDWEYAADDDPLWDLASLIEDAELETGAQRRLLAAWAGRPPEPALWQRLVQQRAFTRWVWACWALAMSPARADTLSFLQPCEARVRLALDGLQGR